MATKTISTQCGSTPHCLACSASAPWWPSVERKSHLRMMRKGTVLLDQELRTDCIYILCWGSILRTFVTSDGEIFIETEPKVGQWLGLTSLLTGCPCDSTSEVQKEDCMVRILSLESLREILDAFPTLALKLLAQSRAEIFAIRSEMRDRWLSSPRKRLAELLLTNSSRSQEGDYRVHLSRAELAAKLWSSERTITKLIFEFKQEGLIERKGHELLLLDRRSLQRSFRTNNNRQQNRQKEAYPPRTN